MHAQGKMQTLKRPEKFTPQADSQHRYPMTIKVLKIANSGEVVEFQELCDDSNVPFSTTTKNHKAYKKTKVLSIQQ